MNEPRWPRTAKLVSVEHHRDEAVDAGCMSSRFKRWNQFEPAELDKGTFHGLEVQDLSLKTLGQTLTVRVRTR